MRRSLVACCLSSVLLTACPPADETSDAGSDAGSVTGETLELIVERTYRSASGEMVFEPLAGAVVAAELPGGGTQEFTSDSAGTVSIPGVDWSQGTLSLSGYDPCCDIVSTVGTAREDWERYQTQRDDGKVHFALHDVDADVAPTLVTIHGTLQNMLATDHTITVSTDIASSSFQEVGADWSLQVPPGKAFRVVALEWSAPTTRTVSSRGIEQVFHQWTIAEHAAVEADTEVTLDFTASATPVHFSGSWTLPTDTVGSYFDRMALYLTVQAGEDRNLFVGALTRSDLTSDGTQFEYEGEYVEVPGQVLNTRYAGYPVSALAKGFTLSWVPGAPTDGAASVVLAEPMPVDPPAVPGVPYSIDGSLSWQRRPVDQANADMMQVLVLYRPDDTLRVQPPWFLHVGRASTAFTFPTLPSTVNRRQLFGTANLQGYLYQQAYGDDERVAQLAYSGPLDVAP